jgi:TM2 domain-containing membrane protein YozV
MAKKTPKKKTKKPTQGIAIVALLLNILVLPGLGSIIGGKTNPGTAQLILFLAGIPLSLVLIGIPLIIAAWIWGIVTGIEIIKESEK